jgi:hypothetical protein
MLETLGRKERWLLSHFPIPKATGEMEKSASVGMMK